MMASIQTMLARITSLEADLQRMREMLEPQPRKWLYNREQAERKKRQVDYAYRLGQISYHSKRGIKAAITKLTVGWVPPAERDKQPTEV